MTVSQRRVAILFLVNLLQFMFRKAPDENPKTRWNKRRIGLLLISVLLVPYLFSRYAAMSRLVDVIVIASSSPRDFENAHEVTILIFNIAHGRGPVDSNLEEGGAAKKKRIEDIAELLKNENADIVILNECDFFSTWSGHQNQAEALAELAGYPYRGEQRNLDFRFIYGSWQFGNAILSKFPITDYQMIDYPGCNSWEPVLVGKKRGASFTIELSADVDIQVVPIHLEHRSEEVRVKSIDKVLDSFGDSEDLPILAGDFNSTPAELPGAIITANGSNTIERVIETGNYSLVPSVAAKDFTFPSREPVKTIDWIMVPHPFEVLESRVIDSILSDHRPVFARLKMKH